MAEGLQDLIAHERKKESVREYQKILFANRRQSFEEIERNSKEVFKVFTDEQALLNEDEEENTTKSAVLRGDAMTSFLSKHHGNKCLQMSEEDMKEANKMF